MTPRAGSRGSRTLNGNRTTLVYSGGQLSTVTDPSGRTLSLSYNAGGQISQVTDPAGRTVKYGYDGSANLTSVTNVGGKTTSYAYDGSHQLTQVTYPRGGQLTNTYDSSDRVISQTDPDGGKTTWSYAANETTITDPAGVVSDEKFSNALPTSITTGYGTAGAATTTVAYDANLNPTTIADPNGHEWDYGYDGQNNLTTITDPLGHTTTRTFDSARDLTSLTVPSGKQTTYGYDSHNNLTSVKQTLTETGQTATTALAYNGAGEPTTVTDPLNHSWSYGYDTHGDLTSATSPLGHKSTWTFDQLGGETSVTTARGNEPGADPAAYTTSITLDAFERPSQITDPSGNQATLSYDEDGNLTDSTDRDGHHIHIDYTLAGRPSQVTRADGTVLKTAYYPDGSLKSQTDGLGHTTGYSYDSQGRLQQITDPLGRQTTFAYDPAGNQTKITDAAGNSTTMGYDNSNRLTSASYSTGKPAPVSYSYNKDGLATSITDTSGTSSYSYDSLDHLAGQTNGAGQTTGYGYDLAGELTSITYPDALTPLDVSGPGAQQQVLTGTVTRSYDQDGNLRSVKDWLGHTTTFGYSPEEQLTSTTRPNGTSATYTYNPDGALTDLTDLGAHTSYTRSNEWLLTAITPDSGSGQTFGYDSAQRLTSGAYQYNAADNLTQTSIAGGAPITQTFDAASQLQSTSQGATTTNTFDYDQLGERTSQTPATGPATSYTYDQAGQLTAYNGPDHTSTTGATVSDQYTYDATGLRQTKTSNGQLTNQVWDLADGLPLMIEDGPTAYITGPDGLPIEQIAQDGTVNYYSQDQQGSTTNLTDSSGNTTASYSYDPYGNPTSSTGTTNTPFQYAGQYTDPDTGLQYDRGRYYDPATGQFLTPDPLNTTTRQPYAYANNDPTNLTDPTGLCPIDIACGLQNAVVNTAGSGLEAVGNTAAGVADGATGGLSTDLLNAVGINPNTCSVLFNAANPVGFLGGLLIPGLGEEDLAAENTGGLLSWLSDETGSFRPFGGRPTPLTNSQATDLADWNGFQATNLRLRGQIIFRSGNRYIVQDIDSHAGGIWKMANSPRALGSSTTRMGTYDAELSRIGP